MSLIHPIAQKTTAQIAYDLAVDHVKVAVLKPKTTNSLSGRLFASKTGWGMLSVPNSLVRGAFDALDEPGVELPLHDGRLHAHISVFRPDELEEIGADNLTERGKVFHYNLGRVQEVTPQDWDDVGRVWMIEVTSRELQTLRKSYGLTPLPKNNRYKFHITFAVRRKKVLTNNSTSKGS